MGQVFGCFVVEPAPGAARLEVQNAVNDRDDGQKAERDTGAAINVLAEFHSVVPFASPSRDVEERLRERT